MNSDNVAEVEELTTAVSEELVAKFVEMDRHLNEAKNRFQSTWNYRFVKEKTLVDNAKTGILEILML